MKKNFTLPLLAILLSVPLLPLAAVDTGLELSNTAGLNDTGDDDWYTDHKMTGWLQFPFDNAGNNSVAVEGSLYAAKKANETDLGFFADLDMLRFSLLPVSKPGLKIALDAGRIPVADATGFILNQTVDGAELHGSMKFGNIDFLGAYTGLLNARKSRTLVSIDDYADADTTGFYETGASRVLAKLTAQIPQFIQKSDLVVQVLGQYDMRRYIESNPDQAIDTVYVSALMSGPLSNTLFYSITGIYQSGLLEENDKKYSENSALGSVRLDFYPFPSNQFFAQFVYSPAESRYLALYLPVTFQSAGTLFEEGYANLMKASAGWAFNPTRALNLDAGVKALIYSKKPDGVKDQYRGTEANAGATVRATSDLKLRLDGTWFMPVREDLQYQVSLKAIFSL
jgi:hypothetical protein